MPPSNHAAGNQAKETQPMRSTAREIFLRALRETSISKAFTRHVQLDRAVLRVGEDLYDLKRHKRVAVISIGKAAYTMLDALHQELGDRITGVAVGASDPVSPLKGFRYFRGGHPLPNADSVRGAQAILEFLRKRRVSKQQTPPLVIFLISGGGSAIAEKPISNSITLDDLVATYRALVLSGATIAEINAIRKHLSAIKGGRMAVAAAGAHQVSILVSDVPGNSPDSLASGPTMPDSSRVDDCYAIAAKYSLAEQFPESVQRLFLERRLEETPKAGDPAFAHYRWWTILSNKHAVQSAAAEAARSGFAVEIDNRPDDWDYEKAADYLLDRLRALRQGVERVCLISGGEVTVRVADGGIGGRNQQFVLYCAEKIAGQNITVLSAGTDGIDGNSPAAGAVADGSTLERASKLGHNPAEARKSFNAFPLFEALGDAIITGPTGNNVRDLRILLAY